MGLRVRIVLVVLSLLAVAALAVPLALSLANSRTATLAAERDRQLAALADAAAMPDTPLQRLVDRYHDVYGEGLLIIDADGRTLASRALDISEPGVQRPRETPSSTRPRRNGLRSCRGSGTRSWPRREYARTVISSAPSSLRSPPQWRQAISRDPGCGWRPAVLLCSWSLRSSPARSPGGCCAHSTGSSVRSPR